MSNHDRKVLQKIIEHAERVIEYIAVYKSLDEFSGNSMAVEACVFNIMQIGELAHSALSDEIKGSITSIPWNEIYGMRNRIVHGYADVSMEVVWDTAKTDMVPLADELKKVLADM